MLKNVKPSMEQGHEEHQDSSEYIAISEKQSDDATAKQIHIASCLKESELDPGMSISQGKYLDGYIVVPFCMSLWIQK